MNKIVAESNPIETEAKTSTARVIAWSLTIIGVALSLFQLYTAGMVAMTAIGLARWTEALYTGEILSPRATGWLTSTTTHLGDGVELPGWVELDRAVLGEPVITASGGGGSIGHQVDVGWLPESGRVVVVAVSRTTPRSSFLLGHVMPALLAGTGVPGPPILPEVDPAELAAVTGQWALPGSADPADATVRIEPEDGGIRVEVSGSEALDLIFRVPEWKAAEAARHEEAALAFAAGDTAEGQRWRSAIEAERGPIHRVEVEGTAYQGELISFLRLHFGEGSGAATAQLGVVLNPFGGTEALGVDSPPPTTWLVPDGDGVYGPIEPDPQVPSIRLRPGGTTPGGGSDGSLTIEGPSGTVVLERTGA